MLAAENIVKQYRQPVLNGVSLTVGDGEIVGLAGENGSGKSTLLSILTTAVTPDGGTITADGEVLSPRTIRRLIGYVPQDYALFEHLSALDNIKLWASAYQANWKNALPFLFPEGEGLTEEEEKQFLKKRAGQLSGGMKKRLSIALSLMHEPRYLIMDEPSAGLDIGFKRTLKETMKTLRARGRSVVFTSHQPDELLLCDRIYVLRGGVFVYEGEPGILADSDSDALDAETSFTDALYRILAHNPGMDTERRKHIPATSRF